MRTAYLIARRELEAYLRTMSGYVILALLLAVLGLFFNSFILSAGARKSSEVLGSFFGVASIFTMTAAVLISMRLLAEERQKDTVTLLYSAPIRDGEIVAGKFGSAML